MDMAEKMVECPASGKTKARSCRRMRQQAEMEFGRARSIRVHAIRMRRSELTTSMIARTAMDAETCDDSVVESTIMGEGLAASADHLINSDDVRYVIDSLANDTIVPYSLEQTDDKEDS
uniref:Uncharacterized protein n=1 Tax=Oryza sativa subsp. japonica TaxID=39947 RepID=Q6YYI1_ORYSJ|nr:hypothetical protein [Oryza sativa Japonica Group]BAD16247.1 hypothetical protein [Oryza sativa Japonica Group]